MAANRQFAPTNTLTVPDTTLTGANDPFESGDPVLFGVGAVPAVCLNDEADSQVVVEFGTALVCYRLPVVGVDGAGNSAVAAGDLVYYDTGVINADDANGAVYGTALEPVASGATTTIVVAVGVGA